LLPLFDFRDSQPTEKRGTPRRALVSSRPALHSHSMKIAPGILIFLVLVAPAVLSSLAGSGQPPAPPHSFLALVGTYTNKTESKGIYAFSYDSETGQLTPKGVAAETPDPSFVVIHPSGKYAYAVNEAGKQSTVSAFALDAQSGKLRLLNELPALGEDPCYLSFDKTGQFVLIANYSSGSVVVFPILADGKLGEHSALFEDRGTPGPNKERQEGPHAHWIELSAHNRFAYVADLGLDRVAVYQFDAVKGTLSRGDGPSRASRGSTEPSEAFSLTLSPGTGPRHVAFSHDGKFMYVLGELLSTVTVFANQGRESRMVQTISTLPAGFTGRNDAAEIAVHPNGKWLYTSNRGNDTIAVFDVEPGKGTLRLVENVATGGKEPRHFAIDPAGKFLLAENQNSDSIVTFRIDRTSGKLTPTGEVAHVPSPVCLAFRLAQ
jgi:6-phosphogluconolactonase